MTYSEAYLDKSNVEYQKWIMDKDTWGGAIELSILTLYYKTEITVFDIQTQRIDKYGEGCGYRQRVMLIYDGIHYDPLALTYPGLEDDEVIDQTVFPVTDDISLVKAHNVASEAHKKRQFTNVAKFTLRCIVCQQGLIGESEAMQHAKQTGHINFSEYK